MAVPEASRRPYETAPTTLRPDGRAIASDVLAYTAAVVLLTLAFVEQSTGDAICGLVFILLAAIDPWRLWHARSNQRE